MLPNSRQSRYKGDFNTREKLHSLNCIKLVRVRKNSFNWQLLRWWYMLSWINQASKWISKFTIFQGGFNINRIVFCQWPTFSCSQICFTYFFQTFSPLLCSFNELLNRDTKKKKKKFKRLLSHHPSTLNTQFYIRIGEICFV